MFGKELIIDLHECDRSKFNRKDLEKFCIELCDLIDMNREAIHFWDYTDCPEEYEKAPDHLKGTSLVQFISTSNITIHALDVTGDIYFNIFSCKSFKEEDVIKFIVSFFNALRVGKNVVIERG